jgi:hypothetical protein
VLAQPSSKQRALAKNWNKAARDAGAAKLDIVNEVDDEEVPPLPDNFVYSERSYTLYVPCYTTSHRCIICQFAAATMMFRI